MSLPDPITRKETLLNAAAIGQTTGLPDPITREETYLKAIAENSGGGGGGAVSSVNGKTGAVVLGASDVGALPSGTTIPTKTSDLNNDSNFVADASYIHTDNNYDATAKGIVDGVTTALAGKQDTISDLATIRSGAAAGATAVQPSQLPGVATTQTAGLVKPDGTTITITQDGTISSVGGGDEGELLTGTLLAASWNNKSQTVSVTGLNSSDIGVVGVLDTATSAQLAAAEGVTPVSVSNGTITFTCEDVPTVDIPFGIVVTGTSSNGNLPDGGTTGQVLKKKSNTDLDVEWGTVTSIPNGGTTGQVLSKHSNTDGDVEWTSPADTSKMYSTNDTAFTDIADGDYIPVYDTSATTKKKSLWSNIKSVLKTYFDTLYQKKVAYSTSEQVIGTWITGKPLYQMTVNFGTLPNKSQKTVSTGLPFATTRPVYLTGFTRRSSDGRGFTLPRSSSNSSLLIDLSIRVISNIIYVTVDTNDDVTTCDETYITIQYTKTTD